MNTEIKKLEEEKAELLQKLQMIEQTKNELLTRVVELQGVIKYFNLKEEEDKNKET